MIMDFVEGTTFNCHADFATRLDGYEKTTMSKFCLVGMEKINKNDPLFERFKYRVLRYQCKQGPRKPWKN